MFPAAITTNPLSIGADRGCTPQIDVPAPFPSHTSRQNHVEAGLEPGDFTWPFRLADGPSVTGYSKSATSSRSTAVLVVGASSTSSPVTRTRQIPPSPSTTSTLRRSWPPSPSGRARRTLQ